MNQVTSFSPDGMASLPSVSLVCPIYHKTKLFNKMAKFATLLPLIGCSMKISHHSKVVNYYFPQENNTRCLVQANEDGPSCSLDDNNQIYMTCYDVLTAGNSPTCINNPLYGEASYWQPGEVRYLAQQPSIQYFRL